MPNVSELQRVREEQEEELRVAVAAVRNLGLSKAAREAALAKVRRLENRLGVEAIGDYNSREAFPEGTRPDPQVVTLQDLKDARKRVETLTPGEIGTIIIALGFKADAQSTALIAKLLGR